MAMTKKGIRKNLPIAVTSHERVAVRDEALRRGITMTELIRGWLQPHLDRLMNPDNDTDQTPWDMP